MLSEALCSRARRVSERRPQDTSSASVANGGPGADLLGVDEFEVPFARRAREQGKMFRGGKIDGEHFAFLIFFLSFDAE